MDSVLDDVIGFFATAAGLPLGLLVLTSPIWLWAAVRTRQALQRRRAFRDFAKAHRLEFVGIIPSDKRAPHTRIELVRWAVLLWHVVEGQWDGLPVSVFDMPSRGGSPWTMALVTVEGTLRRGAYAEAVIAARPALSIQIEFDVLCVSAMQRLDVAELGALLAFATALAKAMERDAEEARSRDVFPEAPRVERPMFGSIE